MRKGLRKSLLLDSSSKRRISRKTRVRNKFLSFLSKLSVFRTLKKHFRFSVFLGIFLVIISSFLVFAIFSPYYNLKKTSITQNSTTISNEQIQTIIKKFLGENMLFIQKEEITNILRKEFPEINKVEIKENWPSEIQLNIFIDPPKYTVFDEETTNFSSITVLGTVVSQSSTEGLPVIKISQNKKPFFLHKKLINPEWLSKIEIAEKVLKEKIKLPVTERKILMTARELHLVLSNKTVIWLDLALPLEQQLRKLILAEGKIKLYSKSFHHIDLRVPKQIFWEWK